MELSRIEYKFLITTDEYIKLRFQLEQTLALDEYSNQESRAYSITSVYFDDLLDSHMFQKSDGLEFHQKYRIRQYANGVKRLEFKTKVGNLTSKQSFWLTDELEQAILTQDFDQLYLHKEEELIENLIVRMKCDYLQPTLVIDYEREAYVFPSGNIRITFDKSLRARRVDQDPQMMRLLFEPKYMMLEVKYTGLLPTFLKTLLFTKNFQQVAYSKYYAAWLQLIA